LYLTCFWEFVYSSCMSTFQIINSQTNEEAATAASYIEAVHIADHLTYKTGAMHFVPLRVEKELEYAV
jgi:hypothetical protein